jgi:glycosyltransferase involved in cell wall biosynthesis
MNIALVRGPFLNKFEMMSYEPLLNHHNITAYHTDFNYYDIRDIKIPKKKLKSLEISLGLHIGKLWKLPVHLIGLQWYMIGLENQLRFADVINTAETHNAFSYQAVKAKRKYGAKLIVHQEENISFNHERCPLTKYIKSVTKKYADLFIATTKRCEEALTVEGVPEGRIVVIPHGIDLNLFKPAGKDRLLLQKLSLNEDDFIISFIGRLVKEKGIYDIIYAFDKLIKDRRFDKERIKLVFVGRGSEEENIMQLAYRLGISAKVKFAGTYPYSEMPKIHNLADVTVLPSVPTRGWREQFPRVLLEAMASGKPVISTLSDSIPEERDIGGILIQPGNPPLLYKTLKGLILNDSKRVELGKLARKKIEEKYDAKMIATRLKEVYEG